MNPAGADTPMPLQIEESMPALRRALRAHTNAVLQAPPGTGKTTFVPLALLDEPWLAGKTIIMLEPRRLAARAAARRMATMLDQDVGGTVGYRVHMDSMVGPKTRIEVVTEGILTRRLQHDQALAGVGLVIFDEFHERSIHADLGLALTLDVQRVLRSDLRVLVMSATLDGEAVAALMGQCPMVTGAGKAFPVETKHVMLDARTRIEQGVVTAVLRALSDERGSILVFLPGMAEIRRVEEQIDRLVDHDAVLLAPLHGTLSRAAQDAAILPAPDGMRKIVLATSIAETSLTIEGIRVVIDSGQMRVSRFDPNTGMSRLVTVRVTKASADQRRGRAGRMEPGVCYRLWPEAQHTTLEAFNMPEILDADLAPLALDLASWGVADPQALPWLEVPPSGTYAQARELLTELGALDAQGAITRHGRQMADLGTHPRLAHMMIKGHARGCGSLACELAALLVERDILRTDAAMPDPDIRTRLDLLRGSRGTGERVRLVKASARYWQQRLGIPHTAGNAWEAYGDIGPLLALAYPDRVAKHRPGGEGTFLLRNGSGAQFTGPTPLANEEYLVIADLDARGRDARIFLAAPYSFEDVTEEYGDQIVERRIVEWDERKGAVVARRQRLLGALVLQDDPLADVTDEDRAAALIDGIRRRGIECLPWDNAARQWQARVQLLRSVQGERWPDVSDNALRDTLASWLAPHVAGMRKLEEIRKLDLSGVLRGLVPWGQQRELDALAPTHLDVPSGSHIPLDYATGGAPVLAVRVQEMFGMLETPRIAGGQVPVLMHFLSPAGRPVQVTQDLASFWRTTYQQVKKDLKGRYPKHYWPDDPFTALPTRRAKRAKS